MLKKKILGILNKKKILNVEKFLDICLYDDEYGYYKNSQILGSQGDFTTSPEISQCFGDILGLFILNYWQKHIKEKINLIELGPGNGTLLNDILTVTKKFKDFHNSISINLIEKNKKLVEKQKIKLSNNNIDINWSEDFLIANKKNPAVIIANEFFDCFPVRQFFKKKNIWYEKMIAMNEDGNSFFFKDHPVVNSSTLAKINEYKPNEILEFSKSREDYFSKICKYIHETGGVIIMIDYGYYDKPNNFTLQSLFNHKKSNVIDNIGYQDISTLVDFKKLINLAKNYELNINTFCSQREFFLTYGIIERVKKISYSSTKVERIMLKKDVERIIDINGMGTLFKVLVISK